MSKVLVVGSAGYIGSHMARHLQDQGLALLVLDDLSSGFSDVVTGAQLIVGDAADAVHQDNIFTGHSIDAVKPFASLIQVDESVVNPAKYYENNVAKTLVLLAAMTRHNVKSFIFSSTAAIFGNPISHAIDENHPQSPIDPYGCSKWMIEQLLQDYELVCGLRSVCLRYFNAAGAQPDASLGERHEPEPHLIPLAIKAALVQGGTASVNLEQFRAVNTLLGNLKTAFSGTYHSFDLALSRRGSVSLQPLLCPVSHPGLTVAGIVAYFYSSRTYYQYG